MAKAPRKTKLRCCASCEWIYKGFDKECPKCAFVSYSAHYVYGGKAYRYAITQEPWMTRKMANYRHQLMKEIPKVKPKEIKWLPDESCGGSR